MASALDILKKQLHTARESFEGTMSDVSDEILHQAPGGTAFPVGSIYAHLVFSEDLIVHSMAQGKPTLAETTFKDTTGASSPLPPWDENWAAANTAWANSVQIDLPKLKEYAQAVYAETDAYINSLTEEDLDKEIELGGWGKKTIAELLSSFLIAHTNQLMGELAAVKGVHGAKGYPF
jgi:hypothetical protein